MRCLALAASAGLLALVSVVDSVSMQGPNAKTQPVGTGPFTFGEWVQGDHIRLLKNKNYWLPGHPYVDEVYFQIFNDPQAMVAAHLEMLDYSSAWLDA